MPINLNIGQTLVVGRLGAQAIKINDMTVSRRHCALRRIGPDDYEVEDLGSSRGTVADGIPVARMRVKVDTPLMLGNFQTSVGRLLGLQVSPRSSAAAGNVAGAQDKIIHIGHLESIFDDYQESVKELAKRRGSANIKRMLPMQIGMPLVMCGGMYLNLLFPPDQLLMANMLKGVLTLGCIAAAVKLSVGNVSANSDIVEEQFDLNRQFQIDYVCPDCKNFLGMGRPVKALLNVGRCPYCKGKFAR